MNRQFLVLNENIIAGQRYTPVTLTNQSVSDKHRFKFKFREPVFQVKYTELSILRARWAYD